MTTRPRYEAMRWSGSRESVNPDCECRLASLWGCLRHSRRMSNENSVFRAHHPFLLHASCLSPHHVSFSLRLLLSLSFFLSLSITPLSTPFELPLEGHPLPRTACPRIRPGVAVSSRAASARASLAIVGPRVHKTGRFSSLSSSSSTDVYALICRPIEKNCVI